jgi:hypothetical protein
MRKSILATAAFALTAMSIYAFTNKNVDKPAKATTEQCPPECCNGTGGSCDPTDCEQ